MDIVRLTCETPKRKSLSEISSLALFTLTQKHTQDTLWPTHTNTQRTGRKKGEKTDVVTLYNNKVKLICIS